MCGIWVSAGYLDHDRRRLATDALHLVRHRGPDGEDLWSCDAPPVVLGHRRLAIIDLDARANQPMASADGRYIITFNGEIFNHGEIRRELAAAGSALKTTSDTEVLLEAFARWGTGVLDRLRGFFAFVALDRHERRLIAGRDRYGIKPLYYTLGPRGLAFASEIKQFRALPDFARRLNDHALVDYLACGLFDHGAATFFENVYQVEPGQLVSVSLDRLPAVFADVERRPWTAVETGEPAAADTCASLHACLAKAVSLGLTSDVPVAVALSGGLDSSVVATLAAAGRPPDADRLRAVGMFFDERAIDESHHARAVAARANMELIAATVTGDELEELFRAAVWAFDEPIVRASMLVQMKLYRVFKANGLKVVLSGQGGDEMFSGYAFTWPALLIDLLSADGLAACIRMARASRVSMKALWTEVAPAALVERVSLRAMRDPSFADDLLSRSFDPDVARCRMRRGRQPRARSAREGRSARLGRRLIGAANLPMLLHYDDRAGMASSVESRPVLLDPDLVAMALSLAPGVKVDGALLKGAVRTAMHDHLPPSVRDRPDKLGFPTPEGRWLAGPFGSFLIDRAQEGLDMFAASLDRVVDVPELRRRLAARRLHGTPIWALASLGEWGTRF